MPGYDVNHTLREALQKFRSLRPDCQMLVQKPSGETITPDALDNKLAADPDAPVIHADTWDYSEKGVFPYADPASGYFIPDPAPAPGNR